MRKIILITVCVVLAGVIGANTYNHFFFHPEQTLEGNLNDKIPSELPGWEIRDLPLAESEEMQNRVEGILNYSEALFREYRRGDTEFSVYIGYWEPRRMPIRLVQAHTPDICWVRNGWEVKDMEESLQLTCQGMPLMPTESRIMGRDAFTIHVYYWHVVGEDIYVNRIIGTWDRLDPIKSLFRFGLHQQQEQFFIRISSNRPLAEIWNDPDIQTIVAGLADLAIKTTEMPDPLET